MWSHALLMYGFPIYLMGFEYIYRVTAAAQAEQFIGPALAAASLSLLFPLTRPRTAEEHLTPSMLKRMKEKGIKPTFQGDETFTVIIWLLMIVGFLIWLTVCGISQESETRMIGPFQTQIMIGLGCYLCAVIIVEVRNRLTSQG